MAVNSADPSSATVTAVALLVLDDATVVEVAEVVTEETLDEEKMSRPKIHWMREKTSWPKKHWMMKRLP